jgi:hypothetical protein
LGAREIKQIDTIKDKQRTIDILNEQIKKTLRIHENDKKELEEKADQLIKQIDAFNEKDKDKMDQINNKHKEIVRHQKEKFDKISQEKSNKFVKIQTEMNNLLEQILSDTKDVRIRIKNLGGDENETREIIVDIDGLGAKIRRIVPETKKQL